MIKLVQTFGAHAGRTREYEQDVVRIGRLPTCDFAFDAHADLDASGLHAEIRREGSEYVLVDAASRNGTLVGGRSIQRHTLSDGDEVEFGTGGPRIRVHLSAAAGPAARAPALTGPATPIDLGGPVSADGPTGYAAPGSVRPPPSFAPPRVSPTGAPFSSAPPATVAPPAALAADPAAIARVVDERVRPLVMAVALMGLLLIVTMCGLTAVALYLVTHA